MRDRDTLSLDFASSGMTLVPCTGCSPDEARFTTEAMGTRRDGRPNTRCPECRRRQASSGGRVGHIKAREPQRDMKALAVVERFVGFPWKLWVTPEGRAAQVRFLEQRGFTFEELWTHRILTLARRADDCRAARLRIASRTLRATHIVEAIVA